MLMRLTGSARELARSMTSDEILHGAVYEGTPPDPVGCILAKLRGLWQLEEASRLALMTEMLTFRRHPNEPITMVQTRHKLA